MQYVPDSASTIVPELARHQCNAGVGALARTMAFLLRFDRALGRYMSSNAFPAASRLLGREYLQCNITKQGQVKLPDLSVYRVVELLDSH